MTSSLWHVGSAAAACGVGGLGGELAVAIPDQMGFDGVVAAETRG